MTASLSRRLLAIADALETDGYGSDAATIREAAAALEENEWREIASAPKDGTPILVWLTKPHLRSPVQAASFTEKGGVIGGNFAFDLEGRPTHWKPLSPPPEGVKG